MKLHSANHILSTLASCFLLIGNAYPKEPLPNSAKIAILEYSPNSEILEWDSGLVNSDNLQDISAIISRGSSDIALVVLYANAKGKFDVVTQSIPWQWAPSSNLGFTTHISRRSVFLEFYCTALCGNSISSGSFQFKEVSGEIVLIGEERTNYSHPTKNDDRYGISTNYLSRDRTQWATHGKKRKKTKERLPNSYLIKLRSFDPDKHL